VHVSITWLKDHPEAYQALCKIWVNEEFIARSMRVRECRGTDRSGHTYGPDGHARTSQRMVRKIITKIHSHFVFLLQSRTHRSVQVANGCLIWKCGRGVTGEMTLQTLASWALWWQKLNWWVIDIHLLHFHYYPYCHVYNLLLFVGKV
jgi:hypothetical protein